MWLTELWLLMEFVWQMSWPLSTFLLFWKTEDMSLQVWWAKCFRNLYIYFHVFILERYLQTELCGFADRLIYAKIQI